MTSETVQLIGVALMSASVGAAAVAVITSSPSRPKPRVQKTPASPVHKVDAPPAAHQLDAPGAERFRIIRRCYGRTYQWKTHNAESAAQMWEMYLRARKTHPGELEFWDGDHRRGHIPENVT